MDVSQEFHHELMPEHLGGLKADDLAILQATQETGDIDILLEWYSGRRLLPAVKPLFYVPHPNQFILGSYGSGKTTNLASMAWSRCLTRSFFKFLNVAPVGRQAKLLFKHVQKLFTKNERIGHLVDKILERPYPEIRFWNGSTMEFLTAKKEYLDYISGEEFDHANIDEAALLPNIGEVVSVIRPRLRGIRERSNASRLSLLTITSVPGPDEDLKARYEDGLEENPDYISIKLLAEHNPFVTEEQLRLMLQDMLPEDIPIFMECEWPEATGRLIPIRHYEACQDWRMLEKMDDLLQAKTPGANMEEVHRIGIVKWEMPRTQGHIYLTIGDPGTVNPPKRGAGVVMTWDMSLEPPELVYLDWVFGNGEITPWVASFKYAKQKYGGQAGFDTTSTQKWMADLVFDAEGIIVHPLNFRRDKYGFLNALRFVLERRGCKFPPIQGLKSQCLKYNLPDDRIPQDLVCTLMMSAWMIRPSMKMEEPKQEGLPKLVVPRGYRGSRLVSTRRGR